MTRAVILLSGGLDSATVLAMARAAGLECYALSISYGQRHQAELYAASRVAHTLGAREHRIMHVNLGRIGGSALTDLSIDVPTTPGEGIPVTYVPARNTIMLSLALAWAEVVEAAEIHIGVNAVDYSGYPDCRPEFIAAFENLAALAHQGGGGGHAARHPRATGEPEQGADHPRRREIGRGLRPDGVLLPGRQRRKSLWNLRFLPPAARGFRGGWGTRSHELFRAQDRVDCAPSPRVGSSVGRAAPF